MPPWKIRAEIYSPKQKGIFGSLDSISPGVVTFWVNLGFFGLKWFALAGKVALSTGLPVVS